MTDHEESLKYGYTVEVPSIKLFKFSDLINTNVIGNSKETITVRALQREVSEEEFVFNIKAYLKNLGLVHLYKQDDLEYYSCKFGPSKFIYGFIIP